MKEIPIPALNRTVPRLGLGCMGMSEFYGPIPDAAAALAVMRHAYEAGVRLFDTADLYGDGQNERLLGSFLKDAPGDVLVASKCGIVRQTEILSDGNFRRSFNGRPDYIKAACERSLARLGVEAIDLYYLHRVDPAVPIEESVGALADLVREGKVRAIGLSEAPADLLERACAVHPVSVLQSEYSLWTRDVEAGVLPACRRLGVVFVPFSPLGRGMIPRKGSTDLALAEGDFRRTLERARPDILDCNRPLNDQLHAVAESLSLTPFQVALAWVLAQGDDILPIPGTRRIAHLRQNVAAEAVPLPEPAIALLNEVFRPGRVAGGRYTVQT